MLLHTLGQGSGWMTAISWQVRKGGQLLSTPEPVYATWKHLWSYSHYWPSIVWATYQKNLTSIFFHLETGTEETLVSTMVFPEGKCYNVTSSSWMLRRRQKLLAKVCSSSLWQVGSRRGVELPLLPITWSTGSKYRQHTQSSGLNPVSHRAMLTSASECWAPQPLRAPL